MKVIVASFQCESNSGASLHPKKYDFEYFEGEDIFKKLVVKDMLAENGFEVIPSVYANALPSGTIERDTYDYYKNKILDTVKNHSDADGIYIYVHGSMEVETIGSGELYLLKEIRKIAKKGCLIALSMDLHANITADLGDYADIVCGYKTAPHTDQAETQRRSVKALVYCLKNKIKPYTAVVKIPMLVKGDTMLTAYEPLKTLEAETAEAEKNEKILGANMFFGHCWVDAENTSASTVVSAVDKQTAVVEAKKLANKLWNSRKEYRFLIEAESPEECVKRALEGKERRIFITDSGDNTTAGAEGRSNGILELFLKNNPQKKVCVAGITSPKTVEKYFGCADGEAVYPEIIAPRRAVIKAHGQILGWAKEIIGRSLTFSVNNTDIIVTEKRSAFIEKGNFDKANAELADYDVVVVKLGYLFEELKPFADRELFALTDGASCVELSKLNLKKIKKPMYPLEDFDWKA